MATHQALARVTCRELSCGCTLLLFKAKFLEAQAETALVLQLSPGRVAVFVGEGAGAGFLQSELRSAGGAHEPLRADGGLRASQRSAQPSKPQREGTAVSALMTLVNAVVSSAMSTLGSLICWSLLGSSVHVILQARTLE